jgi:uncharacterized protein (DUF305 family)
MLGVKRQVSAAVALTVFLTGSALAQQAMMMHKEGAAQTDMMASMAKMQHDMSSAPMTGNADKDFVSMMIPHHQGAVEMAKTELQYGTDPEIRKLASAIIAAQNDELDQMRKWQAR